MFLSWYKPATARWKLTAMACALFDAAGQVIAMGGHMAVHMGSMTMSVKAVIETMKLGRGGVAILNDPYAGGTRLPDITMVLGVFTGTELDERIMYVAVRAPHGDMGGLYPDPMGLCRDVYQEGLRIHPILIVEADVLNTSLLQIILHNVRTPRERQGDLLSQIGACRVGEQRLQDLLARFGPDAVRRLAANLMDHSERPMRAQPEKVQSKVVEAEDFLDSDGFSEEPISIKVAITLDARARSVMVNVNGSSAQAGSSINAVYAITYSAAYYVMRCLLPEEAPATAGLMRPVTMKNGEWHAWSTRCCPLQVLLRALADAIPAPIRAASSGTMNNLRIGGVDHRTGQTYAYCETNAGE